MSNSWQYALTVGPLGLYLCAVARWQSGRVPRVVRGLVDYGMLAFGVGGVLVFGPFGQLVLRRTFREPEVNDYLVLLALLGLVASIFARRAIRRLVVYHVDPDRLNAALDDVLRQVPGRFVRTNDGYEDRTSSRGLRVESTSWIPCTVVEARGPDAELLIQKVRPRLAARLKGETSRRTPVALVLFVCSVAVMIAPLLGSVLSQPRYREALRVLLDRLRGG